MKVTFMPAINRRGALLSFGIGAGASLLAPSAWPAGRDARRAAAEVLPVDDPEFALRSWARLNGDPGGRTTFSELSGMVFGFLPQGDDVKLAEFSRHLYQYRSCTARKMRWDDAGTLHIRTRAWSYYADAGTGELHRELLNPYTNKVVQCPPRISPVGEQTMTRNGPPAAPAGAMPTEVSTAGQPMRLDYATLGNHVWVRREQNSRFHPADTSWFKLEADLLTHVAQLDVLLDKSTRHAPNTLSHNLVAEWQTWMNMHGTPGHILFVGNGGHVMRPDDLPQSMQLTLEKEFPGTLSEPAAWR
jgi:hypothetical protein